MFVGHFDFVFALLGQLKRAASIIAWFPAGFIGYIANQAQKTNKSER